MNSPSDPKPSSDPETAAMARLSGQMLMERFEAMPEYRAYPAFMKKLLLHAFVKGAETTCEILIGHATILVAKSKHANKPTK